MKKRPSSLGASTTYGKDLTESEMGQARKIVHRTPHRSVGLIACSWIQPEAIEYESQLERRFVQRALLFPGVRRIIHQPFTLDLIVEGQQIRYTPDFLVAFCDSSRIVIEVKPNIYVPQHQAKLTAAKEFLFAFGDELLVVTDDEIDVGQIPDNAALLLRYARSTINDDEKLRCIQAAAQKAEGPICIGWLVKATSVSIESVFCLIGRGVFTAPLNSTLDADTEISLHKEENKNASIRFRNWINASPRPTDSGVSSSPIGERNSV